MFFFKALGNPQNAWKYVLNATSFQHNDAINGFGNS